MDHHHYANDVTGWAGEMHQLAENCAAIWGSRDGSLGGPDLPVWNPSCLDLSRVTGPDIPENQRLDGPVPPLRHEDHRPCQWLQFHLPKSKAAELKEMASPEDRSYWISTYGAYMAFIWSSLSKHRAKLFQPNPKQTLLWGEAVNIRRRPHDPPVLERVQGNIVYVALSNQSPVPQLTVEDVVSEAPMSKLAWYFRQLTNGVTQKGLSAALTAIAPIRDKTPLFLRTDSFPPMSNFTTD